MKKLTNLTIAAATITSISGAAIAAQETFIIDGAHTFPRFSYNHLGFSTQLSRFNKTSGKIVIDRAAKTGTVEVVIDMKSVDTGFALLDSNIQSDEFFDVEKFPTATFKSTKILFSGDKPVAVEGNLNIKGISKPVTMTINSFLLAPHPMLKKDALGANATTKIIRSEFNAGKFAPYVGDEVSIDIAVEAIKE